MVSEVRPRSGRLPGSKVSQIKLQCTHRTPRALHFVRSDPVKGIKPLTQKKLPARSTTHLAFCSSRTVGAHRFCRPVRYS